MDQKPAWSGLIVILNQWRIQETGKGGSKVSSAKREESNPREARKIWGYAHFR